MDGRSSFGWLIKARRVISAAGATLLALGFAANTTHTAEASAIQAMSVVVNNIDSLGPAWAQFLAGGIPLWSVEPSPPIPEGLILPKENGVLVPTPFVEYLAWRRSLDPARFDQYHPIVGPELGQLPQTITPPPGGTSTGGGVPPLNTPEPGSLMIAAMLIGAAVSWGRYARRAPVRSMGSDTLRSVRYVAFDAHWFARADSTAPDASCDARRGQAVFESTDHRRGFALALPTI